MGRVSLALAIAVGVAGLVVLTRVAPYLVELFVDAMGEIANPERVQ